jgi:hypothetical protein
LKTTAALSSCALSLVVQFVNNSIRFVMYDPIDVSACGYYSAQ